MKKLKQMCLNVGIKGAGDAYGEIWIGVLPAQWHPGTMMAVARYNTVVVFKDHAGQFYTPSFPKPFSHTLGHESRYDLLYLAHCLSMLGAYSAAQLDRRLEELRAEAELREREKVPVKFVEFCQQLGIKPTTRQLQIIGRGIAKQGNKNAP